MYIFVIIIYIINNIIINNSIKYYIKYITITILSIIKSGIYIPRKEDDGLSSSDYYIISYIPLTGEVNINSNTIHMFIINKKHIKKNTTPYYLSYPHEEWKIINELGNYYISNFGRVYSIEKDKILSTFIQNTGYVCISLYKNGKKSNYTIHRLVARYFIPNPNNYTEIDHIDNNKFNNHISNLQWCTHMYNSAKRDNRYIILYDENKNKLGLYYSAPSLSKDINITKNVINHKLEKVKNGELIDVFDKINNIKYYIKKL